jgi:hypothetical protein
MEAFAEISMIRAGVKVRVMAIVDGQIRVRPIEEPLTETAT